MPVEILEILVILFAGWGAGVVTGLIGASAAVIIVPSLVAFLGYGPYEAIGVSLASDVIASSVAAYTYRKHGNLDLRSGIQIRSSPSSAR